MSDFLGSPPARPRPEPDQARTLDMLATLFVVALVVAMLYVGREIFIPIAIAIPVSFVLSPPMLALRRWGFGRVTSVLIVALAALIIASLAGAVLTRQVSELAIDLPKYQATVSSKIVKLRDAAVDNAVFAKVSAALRDVGEINPHRPATSRAPAPAHRAKNQLTATQENQQPVPVEVHEPAWGLSPLWRPSSETRFRPWRQPSSSSSLFFCNARICATASSDWPDRATCTARPWR
ncbi:MAG: AI-2E family transporter [Methylocella sp.]